MDEQIQLAIYGINKTFKAVRPGVLGVGVIADIENTIFVTDRRLLFVAIPMTGAGLGVGVDVSGMQAIFNKKGIEKKGLEMIQTLSPQQILETNSSNFEIPFEEIQEFKIGWLGTIKIIDIAGRKYGYTIRKKDRVLLKQILLGAIPGRVK